MFKLTVLLVSLLFAHQTLAKTDNEWRTPDLDNLVYMQTSEGLVVLELAPFMAPEHSKQFVALIKEGYYDGLDFYRVIDGFVAQGGDMNGEKASKFKKTLNAEFTRASAEASSFISIQKPEFIAPETGYLNGFSAGRDEQAKQEWLLHCPGNLAMARSVDTNSATSDFYIVIGQATRHLDRNMSSFGRVLVGMNNVQRIKRAPVDVPSGVIDDAANRSTLLWVKMAADIPEAQRLNITVLKADSQTHKARLESARKMDNDFYHFKGNGNLDLCYYPLKVKVTPPKPE